MRTRAPVLARGERIQRQLDVVAQLLGGLGPRGLVVDQLVLRARLGGRGGSGGRPDPIRCSDLDAIDAIDAPAQVMRPEPERELPLEPHGL